MISKENMTTLISSQEAREVSDIAISELEEMSVAYAINSAANTGETKCEWNHYMSKDLRDKLNTLGYKISLKLAPDNVPIPNFYIIEWNE